MRTTRGHRWAVLAVAAATLAGCEWIAGVTPKVHGAASAGAGGDGGAGEGGAGLGGGGGGAGGSPGCTDSQLTSDPFNCGSCLHDCLGGDCTNGHCGPFVFAQGVRARRIVVDASTVYWTDPDTHRVETKRKDGGGGIVDLPAVTGAPYDLHLQDKSIFYSEYGLPGVIHLVTKDQTGAQHFGDPGVARLTWFDIGHDTFHIAGSNDGTDSFVAELQKNPVASPTVLRSSVAPTSIGGLTSDTQYVYFTDTAQDLVARVMLKTTNVTTIDATSTAPGPMLLWLDQLYWADAHGIRRKTSDGSGAIVDVGKTSLPASAIGIDATHVYFVAPDGDSPTGVIGRVPRDASIGQVEIIGHVASPVALSVDDFAVYVASTPSTGPGTIVRIAK